METAEYSLLVAAACVDGEIGAAERKLLQSAAERLSVSPEEAEQALEAVRKGQLEVKVPADSSDRRTLFRKVLAILAADGELAERERRLGERVGNHLTLSSEEIGRSFEAVSKGEEMAGDASEEEAEPSAEAELEGSPPADRPAVMSMSGLLVAGAVVGGLALFAVLFFAFPASNGPLPPGLVRVWKKEVSGDMWIRGVAPLGNGEVLVHGGSGRDDEKGVCAVAYDSAGEPAWQIACPTSRVTIAAAASTPDGGLFLAGSFKADATFNLGGEKTTLKSTGRGDGFVMRLDADRKCLWAFLPKSFRRDSIDHVSPLPDGGVAAVGDFKYRLTVGEGENEVEFEAQNKIPTASARTKYLVVLNPDGTLRWARRLLESQVQSEDVVALSDGGVVVYVRGRGTIEGKTPESNSLLRRYGPDGQVRWTIPLPVRRVTLGAGEKDAVLVTGSYSGPETTLGAESVTLPETKNEEVFVARVTAEGKLDWVREARGDDQRPDRGVVAVRWVDGILVAGEMMGSVTFQGPGGPIPLKPEQAAVSWLAGYGTDGTVAWAETQPVIEDTEERLEGVAVTRDSVHLLIRSERRELRGYQSFTTFDKVHLVSYRVAEKK